VPLAAASGTVRLSDYNDMFPNRRQPLENTHMPVTESSDIPRSIAVIGGGISGLAAAHRLIELDAGVRLTLFEAGDRLGGAICTTRRDGFLIDRGPDNFITQLPYATDLCRRLGLADRLMSTDPDRRKAFVTRRGRLHEIPEGFVLMAPSRIWPVITTPLLSPWGKLRLGLEYFVPRRRDESDESFAAFVTRRLGRETYERIVQPLISSIYTADATRLSIGATMPQFVQMERKHGSLIRGARRRAAAQKGAAAEAKSSGARYSMFVAPRDGMSSLVDAIAARLPNEAVRLISPVARIASRDDGRWEVMAGDGSQTFDAVIVAAPAPRAAEMLREVDDGLADDLAGIDMASSAVVSVAYRREQIGHPLDGFGFVVPIAEGRQTLAGSFSSVKYKGRAPEGFELMRVFVGGACQPQLAELPDEDLRTMVHAELVQLLGVTGEPHLTEITRWKQAMPQYHVGHLDLVSRIEARVADLANFALAGNAYRGVGVPQCIRSGEGAAEQILRWTKDGGAKDGGGTV
jgi:oxygen-dependent protoporphyrinogen oxidase